MRSITCVRKSQFDQRLHYLIYFPFRSYNTFRSHITDKITVVFLESVRRFLDPFVRCPLIAGFPFNRRGTVILNIRFQTPSVALPSSVFHFYPAKFPNAAWHGGHDDESESGRSYSDRITRHTQAKNKRTQIYTAHTTGSKMSAAF